MVGAGLNRNIKNLYGQTAIKLCDRGRIVMLKTEEALALLDQEEHAAMGRTTIPLSHVDRLKNEPKRRSIRAVL